MVDPEDFNIAWRAIRDGAAFQIDLSDHVMLEGFEPEEDDSSLFVGILPSGMAHNFLSIAYRHRGIQYVVCVNTFVIAIKTAMGWIQFPDNSYSVGKVGSGFKDAHELGSITLDELFKARDDDDG